MSDQLTNGDLRRFAAQALDQPLNRIGGCVLVAMIKDENGEPECSGMFSNFNLNTHAGVSAALQLMRLTAEATDCPEHPNTFDAGTNVADVIKQMAVLLTGKEQDVGSTDTHTDVG